jgi:signal transduction histidine kinase
LWLNLERGYSRQIAASGRRHSCAAGDFVGNLLDLSRIESGAYKLRKTPVNARELIRSCVEVERHRAESLGLTLTTDVPVDTPALSGDFEALRRVIRNLIDNAIKYTAAGGRITVSARENNDQLAISVSDTGKGISEADLPHVFDKFYRAEADDSLMGTAAPGVGLGLYLAQHIATQLDGELTVESKPDTGTTFTMFMPRWIEDSAKSEEDADVKALVGS